MLWVAMLYNQARKRCIFSRIACALSRKNLTKKLLGLKQVYKCFKYAIQEVMHKFSQSINIITQHIVFQRVNMYLCN